MNLDWRTIDRWLMGEAWTGSRINEHLVALCDNIGPRWSSSQGEWRAVNYIRDQLTADGLSNAMLEEYPIETWSYSKAEATIVEDSRAVAILPFLRCPTFILQARLVDVGFGTPHIVDEQREQLPGAIAIMSLGTEPFTPPQQLSDRLLALAAAGAAAAVVVDRKEGGRMEYHSASDWRFPGLNEHPLPTVTTPREGGVLLRKMARQNKSLRLTVESRFYQAPSHNVAAELPGARWPQEHLLLGGHHDSLFNTPGGNDNGSGIIAVLETARVLAQLQAATGVQPGRSIRFVTYSGEEQKLQGSLAYVERHYGAETAPRLAINLDELSAGNMKGLVLAFPHLRRLVQRQFDQMGDGLKCHVMAQLDSSSDHFPFLRAGIDAAFLWRWRFVGRHADADFHHEPGDTADKVNVRDLKEYVGQLARLLLRLSHLPPEEWPQNPVTREAALARIESERGQVVRVF